MSTATVALASGGRRRRSPGRRLYPRKVWAVILAVYGVLVVAIPVLHLLVPASSTLHLSDYTVTLVGKILCYATVALAMDLVWGYTGILSLGHGLFFALGGYAMGMYLMRAIGRDGVYGDPVLPDFMVFLDWKELPWYWLGSRPLPPAGAAGGAGARRSWPSSSAGSPSARGSAASTSRSSPRR